MGFNAGKQMAKNTLWNAFERFSLLGVQLICTFIMSRFLTPADFGIVGMLVVFTQIARTLIDSGFATALIREKDVSSLDYSSVFYTNLLLSIIIYLFLFSVSPYIALFYHEPRMVNICRVTFLVIPLMSLQLVQTAILQKSLNFKRLGLITFSASLTSGIISIICASYMKSVWALVIQNVLTYALQAVLLWSFTDWHPVLRFSLQSIKKLFRFSKNLLVSNLIGNVFNNIYSIIIGHFYNATDLGFYSLASRINNVSSQQMTQVIQSVSYPMLSKIHNEGEDIKSGYKKVITITLMFVGSVVAIIMGIGSDLFQLIMGSEEWRIAGKYFCLIGIAGILYPLHAVNQNILNVMGQSNIVLHLEISRRCIMVLIIAIALQFDVSILIASYSLYSIILLFLNLYYCGKPIGYTLREQILDIAPILLKQALIIGVSMFVNWSMTNTNIWVRFTFVLIISVFLAFVLFHKTTAFNDVINLTKKTQNKLT